MEFPEAGAAIGEAQPNGDLKVHWRLSETVAAMSFRETVPTVTLHALSQPCIPMRKQHQDSTVLHKAWTALGPEYGAKPAIQQD